MGIYSTIKNQVHSLKQVRLSLLLRFSQLPRAKVATLVLMVLIVIGVSFFTWYLWFKKTPVKYGPKILVVPHHDVVIKEFDRFYQNFTSLQREQVKTVLLLSPNHYYSEQQRAVTTDQPLTYANASIEIDQEWLVELLNHQVTVDAQMFANEHGINLHLPYIKKIFPRAKVVPILLTRNIPQSNLDELTTLFNNSFSGTTMVVVASIDFSHNLSVGEAAKRDQKTLRYVQSNAAERVRKLPDEHLDCPSCLYLVLNLVELQTLVGPELYFHSDAATYMGKGEQNATTSYFVWGWSQD